MNNPIADLRTLWADVEWWESQGLGFIRPTLKAAIDEAELAQKTLDEAVGMLMEIEPFVHGSCHAKWKQRVDELERQYCAEF